MTRTMVRLAVFGLVVGSIALSSSGQTPPVAPPAGPAAPPAGTVAITLNDNNTVRLAPGTGTGDRQVIVAATNLAKEQRSTAPTVTDHALEGRAAVKFSNPQVVQSEGTVSWLLDMHVDGLPLNSTETHLATVAFGDRTYSRWYTLTNRAAGTATWVVTGPAVPWVVTWDGADAPLTVTVTTQDEPISALAVCTSSLRDIPPLTQIDAADLELGADQTHDTAVPAHTSRPLALRLKSGRHGVPPHGKFSGTVQFCAKNMPDMPSLAITLNASSISVRVLGAFLILVGLWLSRTLVNRIKPTIARVQALKPVLVLVQSIKDERAALTRLASAASVTFPKTLQRLETLEKSLATSKLDDDGLLPSPVTMPFSPQAPAGTGLQSRLTQASGELLAVATVVQKGIEPAVADLQNPAFTQASVKTALGQLDTLGSTAADAAAAQAGIPPILVGYRAAVAQQGVQPQLEQVGLQRFGGSRDRAASGLHHRARESPGRGDR